MDTLLLFDRLILCAVLVVAGSAKLADRPGSRRAMADFGVPAAFAAPAGLLLPAGELMIAAALLPAATAWWGAVAAFVLFCVFTAAIAVLMARGRTPDCHCFGQLHSRPIGRSTLARNAVLIFLAGVIVVRGPDGAGPGLVAWLSSLAPLAWLILVFGLGLLAMAVVQTYLVVNLLRQNGRLLLRLEAVEQRLGLTGEDLLPARRSDTPAGKPVGTLAPDFNLPGLDGTRHTLAGCLAASKPVVLIFISTGCGPCQELLPEIAAWQQTHAGRLTLVLVARGDKDVLAAQAGAFALTHVLRQTGDETSIAYQAAITPSAVLVNPDGKLASLVAVGPAALRALVARASAPDELLRDRLLGRAPIPLNGSNGVPAQSAQAPAPGDPAPAVRLPDLEGALVDLARYHGTTLLVVFWNPGCSFCLRMAPDLRRLLTQPWPGAPTILLVSTGTVQANRALDLPVPILLDQGFVTGFAFGARGTPSAVLIDAAGRVASPVAVGAPAILALAQGEPTAG